MSWKNRPPGPPPPPPRIQWRDLSRLLMPPPSLLHYHEKRQSRSSPPRTSLPASEGRPAPPAASEARLKNEPVVKIETGPIVLRLGEAYTGRRVIVQNLGIDIGTKTVVLAYDGPGGKTGFLSEINGYYVFERSSPFIINMLNDPNRQRADGTKRPARWIQLEGDDRVFVLGRDAEEFAYAKNDTLLRPMAEGGITADEESMTILSSIVQGLMEMAEKEVGEFSDQVSLSYCTTAKAINQESNVAYHEQVVDMIISGYETNAKLNIHRFKESHAIVINDSPDGTGIGISWGAGTVTVSYVKYGMEIYSFCWVGSGDWIDTQVAMRHGYNPQLSKTRGKTGKETPTTVSKRKHSLDLTPGNEPKDRVGLDLVLHYGVLIGQVVDGIVQGFLEHESEAKIDEGIPVYMAGGTSTPDGFEQRVAMAFESKDLPFGIASVTKSARPLYAVAEGLLKAAKMS